MSAIATLIGLVFAAVVVVAQDAVEPSPQPVYPLCNMAFVKASKALAAITFEAEAEVEPTASASPAAKPDEGASPRVFEELALLDDAVRTCSSLGEFAAASALYPGVLGTIDPLEFLLARCHHPASELGQYAACASLERALATPTPAPTATAAPQAQSDSGEKAGSEARPEPKPRTKPEPTPRPTARPTVPQVTKPRIRMTAVPSSYRAPVAAASRVHYFAVSGKTPRQLTRNITRQARNSCGRHAWACLETRGGVRPTYVQNPFNGSCTITGVKMPLTYVAHMPRWTAPSRVPSYMAWWWRKAAARIGWHEAQHARIAKEYAAKLPRMVVGKPCARYGRVLKKWSRSLHRNQQAFDRLDYPRGDRVMNRWWRQAYDRYLY